MRPLIDIVDLVKTMPGEPLRLARLSVGRADRIVLSGFDALAAEMFVHLVTGAAVPDAGDVAIDGRSTREIATDTEWLMSLDRFGLVSDRALLVDGLSIEANVALPITLSVDPLPDEARRRVREVAARVGLPEARLGEPAAMLAPDERARVHLARALVPGPVFLLLEHPTRGLAGPGAAQAFGATLDRATGTCGVGWMAISNDRSFAAASGGRTVRLDRASGDVREDRPSWLGRLLGKGSSR